MAKIAIAGAGVLGAAIAWRMAEAGHQVRIFDPTPGGVASPGSFAWLNASMAEDPVYNRLRHDSLTLWEDIKASDPSVPVKFPGAILWEQEHFDLDAIEAAHRSLDRHVEMLDAKALADKEPSAAVPPPRSLLCSSDGYGDPDAIVGWFLAKAQVSGAELVASRIDKINTSDGRVAEIETEAGREAVDHLILVVGTRLPEMLALVDQDLAMDNRPGLLARTSPGHGQIDAMLATRNVHIWQRDDHGYLIGADFGGGLEIDDPDADARRVLGELQAVLKGTDDCEIPNITVRERPMPADGRPAIGPIGPQGLYVVSTHSGMTLAPIIAQTVTAEIGGTQDPRLEPYRPDRVTLQR